MPNLLIFGSTGTLGGAILDKYRAEKWGVTCAVRKVVNDCDIQLPLTSAILGDKKFDAVVFAQGANVNGSAMQTGTKELNELFEANVTVIAESVSVLMGADAINEGGRVVILSSLWEQFTRQEKFAYSVTKAAVGGLVRSLAVDLGRQKKILVNGILPGIINSPMVARTLSPEQIANVVSQTPIGELASTVDVANSVYMFGSSLNTGISGQSIFVDRGFSVARTI
ncbi:MAG: SDR family oxidoreductase [Actinobacteria bacterium]|nr:SDR family oxidoreductase [Actinomycetota bacterium]MDA2996958.1 SDR family oxidoreductase [Actinomycetota bacterium]